MRTAAALLLILAAAVPASGQIGISPPMFELSLDERLPTQSMKVVNFGENPVSAEVTVHNWRYDENGKVEVIPPSEQSLDQWIILNPLELTIPPDSSRTVRFAVRPKVRPEPGEHRAMIFVSEVVPELEAQKPRMRFFFRIGAAVYATYGAVSRDATLHDIRVEWPIVAFDVESTGNAHARVEGQLAVWTAGAYPGTGSTATLEGLGTPEVETPEGMEYLLPLRTQPALPDTRREIVLRLDSELEPGDYVLDLNGAVGDTALDTAVEFTVPDPEEEPTQPAEQDDTETTE